MTKSLQPEQEIKIYSLKLQAETMTEVEVKTLLVQTYQQMLEKENYYKQEIKKAWVGEDTTNECKG